MPRRPSFQPIAGNLIAPRAITAPHDPLPQVPLDTQIVPDACHHLRPLPYNPRLMKPPPEAFRSADLFEVGIGYVVVCRYKADGLAEAGFFLLDVFCLGVKDAGYQQFADRAELREELLDPLFEGREPITLSAPTGRKLIEDAAAYARRLGFPPAADFKKASRVFGGITAAECREEFVFGDDGRPHFIPGPSDSSARIDAILRALNRSCGPGGFAFSGAGILDAESDDDSSPAPDEPADRGSGSPDRLAVDLLEMARRIQNETPGIIVDISPEDRPAVSDRLATAAEPILEILPDFESKRSALYLASVGWNLAVTDEKHRTSALAKLTEMTDDEQAVAMVLLVAARVTELFPGEDRLIMKLEVERDSDGDPILRVASTAPSDNPPLQARPSPR